MCVKRPFDDRFMFEKYDFIENWWMLKKKKKKRRKFMNVEEQDIKCENGTWIMLEVINLLF